MEGTATISLTEYNSMRDSITELQSLSEKYAEQIQKEQLYSANLKELVLGSNAYFTLSTIFTKSFRENSNLSGITNEEIDKYHKEHTT